MLLEATLQKLIKIGTLTVRFPDGGSQTFGTGREPHAAIVIRTERAKRRLLLNPALALGELYMNGEIEPGPRGLFQMLDFLAMNSMEGGSHTMEKVRWFRRKFDQLNYAARSKRNVAHHYDLDGRLYSLMLDEDRHYSCAYFPEGDETLEEAQLKKKRHIASKLRLDRPGLEALDIGCGWGGMALYLAREFGARVTGLTLSEEQLKEARSRAREPQLEHMVTFELMDYRNWTKQVDRVVSVGMFEHVGVNHFRTYFDKIKSILIDDGVALILPSAARMVPAAPIRGSPSTSFRADIPRRSPRSCPSSRNRASGPRISRCSVCTTPGRWSSGIIGLPTTGASSPSSMTSVSAGCSNSTSSGPSWRSAGWGT